MCWKYENFTRKKQNSILSPDSVVQATVVSEMRSLILWMFLTVRQSQGQSLWPRARLARLGRAVRDQTGKSHSWLCSSDNTCKVDPFLDVVASLVLTHVSNSQAHQNSSLIIGCLMHSSFQLDDTILIGTDHSRRFKVVPVSQQ